MSEKNQKYNREDYAELLYLYDNDEIGGDDAIVDYLQSKKLDIRIGFIIIAQHQLKGTPCENCENAGYFNSMYPCISCNKNPTLKDHFKKCSFFND